MKNCPKCYKAYDDSLAFCLDDGSPLSHTVTDKTLSNEQTLVMNAQILESTWVKLINDKIQDVKVYGSVQKVPKINIIGSAHLTSTERLEAQALKPAFNDMHALVESEPFLTNTSQVIFNAKILNFAELSILRKNDSHDFILSACVVMICNETRSLIVHHRSSDSATYPDCFHTFGGAYDPQRDKKNLFLTAKREIHEESQASVLYEDTPPMIIVLEKTTRFLQLVFLGANISKKQFEELEENWEGKRLLTISFDDLGAFMTDPIATDLAKGGKREISWVPTGKAHVLAWLALGAFGTKQDETFNSLSPIDLFLHLTH